MSRQAFLLDTSSPLAVKLPFEEAYYILLRGNISRYFTATVSFQAIKSLPPTNYAHAMVFNFRN